MLDKTDCNSVYIHLAHFTTKDSYDAIRKSSYILPRKPPINGTDKYDRDPNYLKQFEYDKSVCFKIIRFESKEIQCESVKKTGGDKYEIVMGYEKFTIDINMKYAFVFRYSDIKAYQLEVFYGRYHLYSHIKQKALKGNAHESLNQLLEPLHLYNKLYPSDIFSVIKSYQFNVECRTQYPVHICRSSQIFDLNYYLNNPESTGMHRVPDTWMYPHTKYEL